ncbi:uncharacterized protein EDB91DRAFT_1082606 [Suillus paluster]|uniref:uncharacterized protein n=1 Tax=Suillus paluster TaxID=48578 RepID=UPI001B87C8F0|nr:uncharacterized protein EDB91DRAFT_1082606 [Suillus paluster]KAG1738902.1 hypothetical protein EDB91DRAFT_1082606 [Suillus paluster]
MLTGTYKLNSVARPGQYIALVDGNIVGHSNRLPGVMIEWRVTFHEGVTGAATFQPIRDGQVSDEYIYFDKGNQSLIPSNKPWLFIVKENPRSSNFLSIGIYDTDLVSALLSWDDNTPLEIQPNTDATQQLWMFEKIV